MIYQDGAHFSKQISMFNFAHFHVKPRYDSLYSAMTCSDAGPKPKENTLRKHKRGNPIYILLFILDKSVKRDTA